MELCLRPGGWLSALARLFAAEDPAPQSRAQARPEVNARAEKLLDAYGDLLLRYAYSYLHNMADAEEVLQDTLVQFLKTAPVFLNKAHEKAWLLRVAAKGGRICPSSGTRSGSCRCSTARRCTCFITRV